MKGSNVSRRHLSLRRADPMGDVPEPEPRVVTEPPRLDLFMIVIRVAHWQATVRWYIDTLGLAPILLDAQHEFALLAAGSGRLGIQGVKVAGSLTGPGKVRLVYQVHDLDHERQRLIERGVAVGAPIENHEEGYREVRLKDPEGYSLRLFAWTDPARRNAFLGQGR
jgi:predicted enzyme related to lactoylglutathione lyase